MKGTIARVAFSGSFALLLGLGGIAAAETNSDLGDGPFSTAQPLRTYRWNPNLPSYHGFDQVQAAQGFSNVIYLNNCKAGNGCRITPGNDNALNNTSSIPSQTSTVTPFAYSDAVWQQVVDCVRATYSPFAVQIVTERPTSGNYHMAIVAGTPQNVQMQNGVGGVSPYTCGYIPNAISFSFANIYGGSVDDICWTVAQETAHSWGLDHKFDNRDPMTYLQTGPSRKSFQNETGYCGTFNKENCLCGGTQMNSFKEIMDTFGGSTPTPPTIHITAPANNATGLDPGFVISADAMDDTAVAKVTLKIDGVAVGRELTTKPYQWTAPQSLAQGMHTIEITAYDVGNTPATDTIHASLGTPCATATDCANDTDVCVDGRCVVGGGTQGGLGTSCTGNTDCASGQCAMSPDGNHCVEPCDLAADGCPGGFTCTDTGNGNGVCWPGGDAGDGICNAGGSAAPGLLLIGIAAAWVTRRRRRS